MAAVSTNDLKNGMTLDLPEGLFSVVEFQHVKPGKGGAFVRTKLKNVRTGAVIERTYRADEKLEQAVIDKREMQYLYLDGDALRLHGQHATYDQLHDRPGQPRRRRPLPEGGRLGRAADVRRRDRRRGPARRGGAHRDRDRAGAPGRPGVGRPQAGHLGDRPRRAGAAVRQHRRPGQGRHPHRGVPDPGRELDRAHGVAAALANPGPAEGPGAGHVVCCTRPRPSSSSRRLRARRAARSRPTPSWSIGRAASTARRAEIDALIARFAIDWALERMPVIDRTLLRMATFELSAAPTSPPGWSSPRRSSWPSGTPPTSRAVSSTACWPSLAGRGPSRAT